MDWDLTAFFMKLSNLFLEWATYSETRGTTLVRFL